MNRWRTWGSTYPRFANRGIIAPHTPLFSKAALALLNRLIREGKVERVGRGAATRYRRL